jgi:glycosyltransferase involved in cell wall biosynthesis
MLGIVAPGRPLRMRLRGLLRLPRDARRDAAQGREAVAGLRGGGARRLVVFVDRPFEPAADSASHRLAHLLRIAVADGWDTSLYSTRSDRWYEVEPDGVLVPAEPPVVGRVAWVVRPEAAATVMPALAALRPDLRVVYDSMDLHYLRLERESRVTGSRGRAAQARLMKSLEREVASSADVAVAITDREAVLLQALAAEAHVAVLPNVHSARVDEPPPLASRSGLLFVGNFSHAPNVDAARTLAGDVMPLVWRERPELQLHVAGRGLELGGLDRRIVVHGFVDDLDALADRAALLVAPLRFGAGLKGKIGYALARGLPVVTTEVGAEGFVRRDGMVVAPDGDWQAFADRALALLADPDVWARTSAAGIALTREEYSPERLAVPFRQILEPEPAPRPAPSRARRIGTRALSAALGVVTLLVLLFVALPEALGDRPYNALGH